MTCDRREEALLLHAHGQLTGVGRLLVEHHLETCGRCRGKWARWVMEKDAMRHALAPPPEMDPGAERLMTAVAVRIRTEPRETHDYLAGVRDRPARDVRRNLAVALAVALLALATTAVAAFWPPVSDRLDTLFRSAPSPVGAGCGQETGLPGMKKLSPAPVPRRGTSVAPPHTPADKGPKSSIR